MSRIERLIHRHAVLPAAPPAPVAPIEARGRTARKVRNSIRRGSSVILRVPRWGAVSDFLEAVALELAVGEPAFLCRTVGFPSLRGRSLPEVWQVVLHLFSQLGEPRWVQGAPLAITDAHGFRYALGALLDGVAARSGQPCALLVYGLEHLPVQVVSDLCEVWNRWRKPEHAATLLLATAAGSAPLTLEGAELVELADYGEDEALAALSSHATVFPSRALRAAARFTGGIPCLVDALCSRLVAQELPSVSPTALLDSLGPLADELRGAVDIASTDDALSDRLQSLLGGDALPWDPEVDGPLSEAGLVRSARGSSAPMAVLRAPALAALVA